SSPGPPHRPGFGTTALLGSDPVVSHAACDRRSHRLGPSADAPLGSDAAVSHAPCNDCSSPRGLWVGANAASAWGTRPPALAGKPVIGCPRTRRHRLGAC